jgi:chromosome condensin MukBEF complex kleisin-like MukF subunit
MLKKKTETSPEVVAIREVPGTSYVILPGNRLARLLKVSVYNGKEYYNPIINGDLQRIARDELTSLVEKPKAD